MHFPDLTDEYNYWEYALHNRGVGRPPLIKKTSRLIWAVVNNSLYVLRDLLDSPEWYNVRDKLGYSLLQIAICKNRKNVFDYLLSLPDYPVEYVNEQGLTAAAVAFGLLHPLDISHDSFQEYFAYELLQKGVNLDAIYNFGETPLSCALKLRFFKISKLFIEKETDIDVANKKGATPLELAFKFTPPNESVELVNAILIQGAPFSVKLFEKHIFRYPELEEILFLHTFDSLSDCVIDFEVVLTLAKRESWMFDEILKLPIEIGVDNKASFRYFYLFCSMKTDYLRKIVERFGFVLNEFVLQEKRAARLQRFDFLYVENLNLLVNSDFKDFTMDVVHYIKFYNMYRFLIPRHFTEEKTTQLFCFLLSYGCGVEELSLQHVYKSYGYCQLFKILLHMDYKILYRYYEILRLSILSKIIYDPTVYPEECLEFVIHYDYDKAKHVDELVRYFADRRLVEYYEDLVKDEESEEVLPHFPSLVELARNEFRDYFIRKFYTKTSKRFFTLINSLPINDVCKKILTFEQRLY